MTTCSRLWTSAPRHRHRSGCMLQQRHLACPCLKAATGRASGFEVETRTVVAAGKLSEQARMAKVCHTPDRTLPAAAALPFCSIGGGRPGRLGPFAWSAQPMNVQFIGLSKLRNRDGIGNAGNELCTSTSQVPARQIIPEKSTLMSGTKSCTDARLLRSWANLLCYLLQPQH